MISINFNRNCFENPILLKICQFQPSGGYKIDAYKKPCRTFYPCEPTLHFLLFIRNRYKEPRATIISFSIEKVPRFQIFFKNSDGSEGC